MEKYNTPVIEIIKTDSDILLGSVEDDGSNNGVWDILK